jgi:hypothetical protein
MSLDGFIAGVDDAMAWIFEYGAPMSSQRPSRPWAILAGRLT